MFSFCCLYLCMAYLWQSKTSRKCFAHLIPWDGGGGQMNSLLAWWQASFNLLSYLTSLRTITFKRQSRSCNSLLKNIPSVSWYSQNKQQNPKPTRDPRPSKTSSYLLLLALSPHWVISTLIYHKLFVPAHVRVTATLFSLLRRLLSSPVFSQYFPPGTHLWPLNTNFYTVLSVYVPALVDTRCSQKKTRYLLIHHQKAGIY